MIDVNPKTPTDTYLYLKGVASRLSVRYGSVARLTGQYSDKVQDVVRRQCVRDWESAIEHALNTGYPADDVRAAWCRLDDEKKFLTFLETKQEMVQRQGLRAVS